MHVPVTLLQPVPGFVLGHEPEPGHELEHGPGSEVGHIQKHSEFRNFRKYT